MLSNSGGQNTNSRDWPGTWLNAIETIARAAGELILQFYARDVSASTKADGSPVTEADEAAERLIVAHLQALAIDTPVIAEESATEGHFPDIPERFWLVDPLDGTKEFLSGNGEFTVNIALVDRGRPILGVVFAPAIDQLFCGASNAPAVRKRAGATETISVRTPPSEGLTVVSSRSHNDPAALENFLSGRRTAASISAGSSLKLCMVATGEADLYPRLGRTMEWDIAAGHAVLNAAGGRIMTVDGDELRYGKSGFANPHFMACGAQP